MSNITKSPKIPDDIEDMKAWAESFGNLHYKKLAEFIYELSDKIINDSTLYINNRKSKLGGKLLDFAEKLFDSYFILEDLED